MSNHDVLRTVTRYGRSLEPNPDLAHLALALLMTLRGTVLLYQGEELGLPDGPIERHQIRDPVGELYFPFSKGRDPCRTPMPWVAGKPHLGFSHGEPWLPVAPAHAALAAASQERDPNATLHLARRLVALRKAHQALRLGSIVIREASARVLAFERVHEGSRVVCVFNLSGSEAASAVETSGQVLLTLGRVRAGQGPLNLGPLSAIIYDVN
jgi:alpha-glucosidase